MLDAFVFIRPWWLLGLLPAMYLCWRLYRGSASGSQWHSVVDPELLNHLLEGDSEVKRNGIWSFVAVFAWVVCVLALAGPSWERKDVPTYRNVSERVLVIDLSRSMNAEDIKPSRLSRVKQKVEDILKQSGEIENAIVVFAASPFVVAPLTNDSATVQTMLSALETNIMPAQGSRIGEGLRKAFELLQSVRSNDGRIVLFTDSPVDSDTRIVTEEIARSGLSLSVIGVGSVEGAPIPLPGGGFVKDRNGNIVVAKIDEAALRDLAELGGGEYRVIATDESDINAVLQGVNRFSGHENDVDSQGETSQQLVDARLDRGPWFMLLLLPLAPGLFRRGWL